MEAEHKVLEKKTGTGVPLSRREMIRTLLGGAGSSLVLSHTALAHPMHKYLTDGALLAGADSQVAGERWKPQCLDAQQNETLVVVAEDILPNSSKALVNRFIDLLLSVDSNEARQQFSNSLAAFDQESMRRFHHPFREVPDSDRQAILTSFSNLGSHSAGESISPDAETSGGSRTTGEPVLSDAKPSPAKSVASEPTPYDHFQNLKTWIVGAYYSSEFGMRELGWTGMLFFENYPGCQHLDGHV
jgi:hypothetical protein